MVFDYFTLPIRYIGDENGWVQQVEFLRMELGEPDASGRRRPVPVEGSETIVPMDGVICAIGNSPNPLIPMTTTGLEVRKNGAIVADPERARPPATGCGPEATCYLRRHRDPGHGRGAQGGALDARGVERGVRGRPAPIRLPAERR